MDIEVSKRASLIDVEALQVRAPEISTSESADINVVTIEGDTRTVVAGFEKLVSSTY